MTESSMDRALSTKIIAVRVEIRPARNHCEAPLTEVRSSGWISVWFISFQFSLVWGAPHVRSVGVIFFFAPQTYGPMKSYRLPGDGVYIISILKDQISISAIDCVGKKRHWTRHRLETSMKLRHYYIIIIIFITNKTTHTHTVHSSSSSSRLNSL